MGIEVVADEGDRLCRPEPGVVHQSADQCCLIGCRASSRFDTPSISPLSQRFHERPYHTASFSSVFVIHPRGSARSHRFQLLCYG